MASWLPRRNKISRRAVLRGMLGGTAVAVGLPALELFLNESGTAYADCPGGLPTVFGVLPVAATSASTACTSAM